jgi:paraquat-inducible protein B
VFTDTGESGISERKEIEALVAKGLRAQLQTGSLLTGQLFVDLDFHPDAPPAKVNYDREYPELPTLPATMEMITVTASKTRCRAQSAWSTQKNCTNPLWS